MIILDTNVVSEILRPAPEQRVINWLAAQDGASQLTPGSWGARPIGHSDQLSLMVR